MVGSDLPWDEAQREFMRQHRPQSLVERLLEPEEVAHMVTYLASPLASATTGGALRADGGYVDAILPDRLAHLTYHRQGGSTPARGAGRGG